MYIEDDYIHHSYQIIDSEGRLKIPDDILRALRIEAGEELQVIATTKCLIIEPIREDMYVKPYSAKCKLQNRKNAQAK